MKHKSLSAVSMKCVLVLLIACYNGQSQVSPTTPTTVPEYMEQAQRALRANQPDAAAQAYRAILKLDPKNVEARANLGVVAMSTGDWSRAVEELKQALALKPSDSRVEALLGLCEARQGQKDEAFRLMSAAFPNLEDAKLKREIGMRLVSVQFDTGQLEQAGIELAALQQLYPSDPAISYAAFRVYSELEFQAIESLAVNSPDSAQLHRAMAEHLVNNGRSQAAIAEYRDALAASPDAADLHFELGQAIILDARLSGESHLEGRLAEAQKEFDAALRLNPKDARCECQLAEIETLRSNPAGAASHFANALKLDSESACAKAGLADQLIEDGKEQQALEYLKAAAREDPYNEQVHYHLSVLYRRMGNKEDAAKEVEIFKHLREAKDEIQQALHPKSAPE